MSQDLKYRTLPPQLCATELHINLTTVRLQYDNYLALYFKCATCNNMTCAYVFFGGLAIYHPRGYTRVLYSMFKTNLHVNVRVFLKIGKPFQLCATEAIRNLDNSTPSVRNYLALITSTECANVTDRACEDHHVLFGGLAKFTIPEVTQPWCCTAMFEQNNKFTRGGVR